VRELFNALESAYTSARGDCIGAGDLTIPFHTGPPPAEPLAEADVGTLADSERALILRTLRHTGGNKRRAAQLLGISRKKLYARLAKYESRA
jgi:DNA-binding NtrC family response regulator